METKPEVVTIVVTDNIESLLVDKRPRSWGNTIGTIKDVSRQYGILMKEKDGVTTFTAPKARMQMFVEKLHFAGTSFYVL